MNIGELRRWLREQGCTFHTHKGGSGTSHSPAGRPHQPVADARRSKRVGAGTGSQDQESPGVGLMIAYPITLEDDDGDPASDFPRLPSATEAVPEGVGPVVVGDCPSPRDPSPHRVAMGRSRARPNYQHRKALVELADDLGRGHILTDRSVQRETRHDLPGSTGSACRSERALRPNAPTRCKIPRRRPARR